MKKLFSLFLIFVMILNVACTDTDKAVVDNMNSLDSEEADKPKPEIIIGEDFDENGGADAYDNAGDNKESRYYVNPDFFNMESDEQLTIIPNFKTIQQSTEWACGNTTTLMVLNHLGKTDISEMDLAEAMKSSLDIDIPNGKPGSANNFHEYGTDVKRMHDYLIDLDGFKVVETSYKESYTDSDLISEEDGASPSDIGNLKATFSSSSLYASENDDATQAFVEDAKDSYFVKWLTDNIKAGRPIMVEWGDWDGHWQAIIGYDNNGTPGIGDDILIFADPYDTSDHWQDGYYYYPLERWFFMWKDRNVAPKPYQIQPYMIIDIEK